MALRSDERAEDIKDDLQVEPNFPDLVLKPSLPPRTYTKPELVTPEKVVYSKAANSDGAMIALRIPNVAARRIALKGGEDADDLHVTLIYLGDADDIAPECLTKLHENLARVARHCPPLVGRITGCGRFRPQDKDYDVLWAGLDAPDLPELRHLALQATKDAAIEPPNDHGFTPHITLAYVDEGEGEDSMPPDIDVTIKYLTLCVGGREFAMRFTGSPDVNTDQYEPPQTALPESTFSMIQEPKGHAFKSMEDLEEWAQRKGDLIVRADVGGPFCVITKKNDKVSVAVEDHDGEEIRLDDLIVAMKRIKHDYILYGWLAGIDLEGKWVTDPKRIGLMLTAEETISPRFMPCDLLAMDGDLSKTPARKRLELMRVLGAQAGSHWVMPMQKISTVEDELEATVDEVTKWKPSEGEGLEAIGVTVVRADSGYTHGPTDDEAQLSLKTSKDFAFGAGPGAGTERPDWRKHLPDESGKPNFPDIQPIPKDASGGGVAAGTFGTVGTAGIIAPQQGVFRKPRRSRNVNRGGFLQVAMDEGLNYDVGSALTLVSTHPRKKDPNARDAGGPLFPSYPGPEDKRNRGMSMPFTLSKKLSDAQQADLEAESDKIKENQQTAEAQKPHAFQPAKWTHPNGHPRCLLCGDEERIDGCSGFDPKRKDAGYGVAGGGSGDGDSFGVGPGIVGGHRFIVGRLKDGQFVIDPDFKRVNPYEALFLRRGVDLVVQKYITGHGNTWHVHAESGKVLGTHGSKAEAVAQLRAIEWHKAHPTAKDVNNPDSRKPRKFPDVGEEMGWNDTFDAKAKAGPTDEARDDSGKWTSGGGTAVAEKPEGSVDEWERRFGKPGNDPERYKVRMRDASGETLIHPNGDVYSGAPHAVLARSLGMNVDEALGKGYVRGSDSWGGHVSAQFDLKNPKAQENAAGYLREHGKGSEIMIDDKMPDDQSRMPDTAYFQQPAALGKALRYIQSGGTDRSEVSKSGRTYQIDRIAKAKGTVAIDFDGTVTVDKDGTENPKMRRLVEDLTDRGVKVVIFTARDTDEVKEWLEEHDWPALPVTNEKSPDFSVMLDDRAVHFDPTMLDDSTADKLSGFKTWWEKGMMVEP